MGAMISPGVCQILRGERRVGAQQIRLAGSEPPSLDEQPDRDARTHNARFTAADARHRLDAGKCLVKVVDDPTQYLRLFSPGQRGDLRLDFRKRTHAVNVPVLSPPVKTSGVATLLALLKRNG